MVRDLQVERNRLLAKVLGREQSVRTTEDFNPIRGYKSLGSRIREAELKSLMELETSQEEEENDKKQQTIRTNASNSPRQ